MFKVDSGTGSWNQSWLPEMLVTSPVPDIQVTGGLGFLIRISDLDFKKNNVSFFRFHVGVSYQEFLAGFL